MFMYTLCLGLMLIFGVHAASHESNDMTYTLKRSQSAPANLGTDRPPTPHAETGVRTTAKGKEVSLGLKKDPKKGASS